MFTFFPEQPVAAMFDFQNGDYFLLISGNISASNHTRHMILVSEHTFSRSRNPVGKLIRCQGQYMSPYSTNSR